MISFSGIFFVKKTARQWKSVGGKFLQKNLKTEKCLIFQALLTFLTKLTTTYYDKAMTLLLAMKAKIKAWTDLMVKLELSTTN